MNVYDFDNTIYHGESAIAIYWFFLKKMPKIVVYFPVVMSALVKYKLGLLTVEEMLDTYAPYIEQNLKKVEDTLSDDIAKFWDEHMHRIKPFYKEKQEVNDVIITGSPEIFVKEACKRINIKHYIGTTIDMDTGKITRLCYHHNKVDAFREQFGDAQIENFYTDSNYDSPLIELSKNAFLVKGNKIKRIK